MQLYNFETTVHGKWLLAGEHAVLRGSPALVFPVTKKFMKFIFSHTDSQLQLHTQGKHAKELDILFWKVLEHALGILGKPSKAISGKCQIDNSIPIGAGLGLSAAICAAMSQWFAFKGFISKDNTNSFAHELEHLFHGESSGVDIAGVTANSGILFEQGQAKNIISQSWSPNWFLSYTDQIGITSKCVKTVKDMWHSDLPLAKRIDGLMVDSVNLAIEALQSPKKVGLKKLASAINTANNCFKMWGLSSGNVENHIQTLLKEGALAAKPTGSGDGGYVLSLWDGSPPEHLNNMLTPA